MKIYDTLLENFARSRVGGWMFVNVLNHVDRFLLGTTNGRVSVGLGSRFHKHAVLLGCTGARSGLKREVPLLSTPVGGEIVLIASKAGAPQSPAWFGNLKANPVCTLTIGGRSVNAPRGKSTVLSVSVIGAPPSKTIPVTPIISSAPNA